MAQMPKRSVRSITYTSCNSINALGFVVEVYKYLYVDLWESLGLLTAMILVDLSWLDIPPLQKESKTTNQGELKTALWINNS